MRLNNAMSNFFTGLPDLAVNGYAPLARASSSISSGRRLRPPPDESARLGIGGRRSDSSLHRQDPFGQLGLWNGHPNRHTRRQFHRPSGLGACVEAGFHIADRVAELFGTFGNTAANARTTAWAAVGAASRSTTRAAAHRRIRGPSATRAAAAPTATDERCDRLRLCLPSRESISHDARSLLELPHSPGTTHSLRGVLHRS